MTDGWPLLVTGAQRSGTTAIGVQISAALATRGLPFTVNGRLPHLLSRYLRPQDLEGRHIRVDELGALMDRTSVLGSVDETTFRRRCNMALDHLAASIASGTVREDFDWLVETCKRAYGGDRWGDKYNEYMLDGAILNRSFPDAQHILIVRHPSAVVRSVMSWSKPAWKPVTSEAIEAKWRAWHRLYLRNRPHRLLVVSFEDLCEPDSPARSLIAELLGAPFDPEGHLSLPFSPGDTEVEADTKHLYQELRELGAEGLG